MERGLWIRRSLRQWRQRCWRWQRWPASFPRGEHRGSIRCRHCEVSEESVPGKKRPPKQGLRRLEKRYWLTGLLGRHLLAEKLLGFCDFCIPFCELLRGQEICDALTNRRAVVSNLLHQIFSRRIRVVLLVVLQF